MRLSQFKTAKRNIEEGAWVDDIPNIPGIRLKVRGKDCTQAWKIYAEARFAMTDEEWADSKVQEELGIRVAAEALLLDWEGIYDDSGKPNDKGVYPELPFDPEKARELLSDPDMVLLLNGVRYASNVVGLIGKHSLETAAKN